MDFNLFGMNHIHLEDFKFRRPLKLVDEIGQPIDPGVPMTQDPNKEWDMNSLKEYIKEIRNF